MKTGHRASKRRVTLETTSEQQHVQLSKRSSTVMTRVREACEVEHVVLTASVLGHNWECKYESGLTVYSRRPFSATRHTVL